MFFVIRDPMRILLQAKWRGEKKGQKAKFLLIQNSKLKLEFLVWTGTWVLNLSLKIMHSGAQLGYPFIRPSVIAEL